MIEALEVLLQMILILLLSVQQANLNNIKQTVFLLKVPYNLLPMIPKYDCQQNWPSQCPQSALSFKSNLSSKAKNSENTSCNATGLARDYQMNGVSLESTLKSTANVTKSTIVNTTSLAKQCPTSILPFTNRSVDVQNNLLQVKKE